MYQLNRSTFASLVLIALLLAACPKKGGRPPVGATGDASEAVRPLAVIPWSGEPDEDSWKTFDRLLSEQKYAKATTIVEKRLKQARAAKDSEAWARALIRYVRLRTALHGYEKAVRFLKDQPWPEDLLGHTVMHLYYASALVNYARRYSWEIRQRERVASKGPVDLKAWTHEQIYTEAHRAFEQVWRHRGQLGQQPVKHLAEHLELNDYPARIRPTLRDAVSYLWVELLADTSGWRPEHQNELYQLDLDLLLGRSASKPGQALDRVGLGDPTVHPLRKLCAVLDDLQRWHASRDEPEAAFEAQLTRLRQLHARFDQQADRARIRQALRQRLPALRKLQWWAMGVSALAEFVRVEPAPDALVRARKLALQGAEAFPDSPGGRRCHHIVKSIEAPQYQLQAMAADGPNKRSLGVHYKNLRKLYFRAYRLDPAVLIADSKDYNLLPNHRRLEQLLERREPARQWASSLEQTVDFAMHWAHVTPPIKRPGFYAVIASARKDFERGDNVRQGAYIAIGDLVLLTEQRSDGSAEVRVLSGRTGHPVAGAEVWLYRRDYHKGHRVAATARSGADGTVRFRRDSSHNYFLLARRGDDIALDPSYLHFYRIPPPRGDFATMIYTDRAIYRPQQQLHFKAVLYRGRADRADFRVAPGSKLTLSLFDANNQQVAKKTLTTNSFGTASGTFEIPKGRLLGHWRLHASKNGSAGIRVEEYKRPTFEAKFLDPDKPLRLNRPAALKGEARYLFGLPVTSGKVTWRVRRTPVYPWWWRYYHWRGGGSARTQTIDAGTTELAEDGTFNVRFTPRADERLAQQSEGISFRYEISAEITDEGGESRTASRSVRLGFVAVQANVTMEHSFLVEGQPGELTIARTSLDGTASPGKGRYRLVRLKMPARTLLPADQPRLRPPGTKGGRTEGFRTRGDRLRPRWNPRYRVDEILRGWADGAERARGTLTHDADGEATVKIPALKAGAYRLHYSTTDAFGATYRQQKEIVVAGSKSALALPGHLMLQRHAVKVGETARLYVGSGLKDQPLTLDIFRAGRRVERRELRAGRDSPLIEIPIGERHRGGLGLALTVLRDHQLIRLNHAIYVPWDSKQLEVSFATFRDRLRPGAKEKWTVKVSGPAGAQTPARAAEVLAYMYDRSLDAFATHSPPSPISIFPHRTGAASQRASLGVARRLALPSNGFAGLPDYPSLNGERLKFLSGHGIGGPGHRFGYSTPMPVAAPPARLARKRAQQAREGEALREEPSEITIVRGLADDREAAPAQPVGGEKKDKAPPAANVPLRANFSETAFFRPHLLTGADGSVSFEFTVPDSVTGWNVWAHAITRDLQSGSVKKETRTIKELMVRPYLPRFLREGDRAAIKVVVNNAAKKTLRGRLTFDIVDPATEKSVLASFGLKRGQARRPFEVRAGGGTNVSFALKTPARVGLVAIRVVATANNLSDGELRPIPLLPGRMHLAQSRFVTLKDRARRELSFAELKKANDPTRINEQLVVTVDAQLFYSVLSALPYLVNYPYQCTEQTLNRFISTGILSSMYGDYPAISRMAKNLASRPTRLERWDRDDPNRKMALEETPWLQQAQGGAPSADPLINVLDPRIARAERDASLARLKKAQTAIGGFPWFPGGPPSPYITLYILHGFSKGLEFKVDVPKNVIQRAWRYMHRHYLDELVDAMIKHDCCWELITFLNYTLSNYPDASWTGGVFSELERKKMLDFSFKHWRDHAPYLKGYLALTLQRQGRKKDAALVWDSVMDSAKTKPDQGTFWAPEARSWLWYNDRIETHAFAVRTVIELLPPGQKTSKQLDGLVLWLLINKKLNHWKSTRATAEVVYSLAHYFKRTAQLGTKEEIAVTAGDQVERFVFSPDRYSGKKNQLVIPGERIDPRKHATILVEKQTKGFALASATWHFSTERLPEQARGDYLALTRRYFKRVKTGREVKLLPLSEGAKIAVGDELEVQLALRSKHQMEYVHLRDPRPAGFEPTSVNSRHRYNLGIYWYEEIRDSGTNFFFERLPQGEYPFKYRLRATVAGTFKAAPATVQPMYAPEFAGYSAGRTITIQPAK